MGERRKGSSARQYLITSVEAHWCSLALIATHPRLGSKRVFSNSRSCRMSPSSGAESRRTIATGIRRNHSLGGQGGSARSEEVWDSPGKRRSLGAGAGGADAPPDKSFCRGIDSTEGRG